MRLAHLQADVLTWLYECFGPAIANNKVERSHRFLEEALELAQACDCTESEAIQLVKYVYARPKGERFQEVGGVTTTLAALCCAHGLDLSVCAGAELDRITQKEVMLRIREKQFNKPAFGPLPGPTVPTMLKKQ